jgi:hypothetical protein
MMSLAPGRKTNACIEVLSPYFNFVKLFVNYPGVYLEAGAECYTDTAISLTDTHITIYYNYQTFGFNFHYPFFSQMPTVTAQESPITILETKVSLKHQALPTSQPFACLTTAEPILAPAG